MIARRYRLEGEHPEKPSAEAAPSPDDQVNGKKTDEFVDYGEAIGRALIHDSENNDALGKILRYETSLSHSLARKLTMLMTLQSARAEPEQPGKDTETAGR